MTRGVALSALIPVLSRVNAVCRALCALDPPSLVSAIACERGETFITAEIVTLIRFSCVLVCVRFYERKEEMRNSGERKESERAG